jgi:outer membrane protein assembly factor BamB
MLSPQSGTAETPVDNVNSVIPKKHRWYQGPIIPVAGLLFGLVVWLWAYFAYETMFGLSTMLGDSPRSIIVQVAAPGIALLIVSLWFYFLTGYSLRTKLTVFACSLIPFILAFVCIRRIDFDGNMVMIPRYRWDKTVAEKLNAQSAMTTDSNTVGQGYEGPLPEPRPEDMVQFRGAESNGIVVGPALRTDLSDSNPPPQLWHAPIGEGYSQFVILKDLAISMEQLGTDEAVVCYSTATGKEFWKYSYTALFTEAMGGPGPRSTPIIHDGKVYALGATGHACCLDLATGKKLWSKEILQKDGKPLPNTEWGLSSSPLLVSDMVIFNPGALDGLGLVALKQASGETVWEGSGYNTFQPNGGQNRCGYSTPIVMTLSGQPQIVHFHAKGLSGFEIKTGKVLWTFPFENGAGVNVCQPLLLPDQQILICSSYGNGSALVKVNKAEAEFKAEQVWHKTDIMRTKFTNCVLYQGHVYGLDEGTLSCIEPIQGVETWKKKSRQRIYGHGQILLVHDKILVMAENGDLALVKADPAKYEEIWHIPALTESHRVWNPPALVDGIAYIRDHMEMAAYNLASTPGSTSPNTSTPGSLNNDSKTSSVSPTAIDTTLTSREKP